MIDVDRARLVMALSCTASPDRTERVLAELYLLTQQASQQRPEWWRWTCWLSYAITVRRIEAAERSGR